MNRTIIVTHVGTSVIRCLENELLPFVNKVQQLYPEAHVALAFTTNRGLKPMGQKQISIPSLEEAILIGLKLRSERIEILPLHVVGGMDYKHILEHVASFDLGEQIFVHEPLLKNNADCAQLAQAIKQSVDKKGIQTPLLCIGHGTEDTSDNWYASLEQHLKLRGLEALVSTLNEPKDRLLSRLKLQGMMKVTMVPLFVVAGYHVTKDLYDDPNSIKQFLGTNGIEVSGHYEGMIRDPDMAELYIKKLRVGKD